MRMLWGKAGAVVALALLAGSVEAQETKKSARKDLAGTWAGQLKTPQVELRVVLDVKKAPDGSFKADFVSPDQSPMKFAVDAIELKGDTLTFSVEKIGGSYTGKRDAAGEFVGEWSQGGMELPLTLAAADPKALAGPEAPKELAGLWEGALDVGGAKLRLVLRVEKVKGKEGLVPVLDSPDQGANGIPISAISLKDGVVKFENRGIGGKFEGKLDADKGQIEGEWSQAGQDFPLTLKKTDQIKESRRPQHPKPPFAYRSEDVSYTNEPAGITLAGTLTIPPGDGPFPAALLITGSGAQDRDETVFAHKPFLVLADALTRSGIAVLRVDDRGVGKSTGRMDEVTTEDFAGDVLAGVAYLRTRKEIDPKAMGLVGHSEGGLIAPMVAVRSADVAFAVLLASPGLPGEEIVLSQSELILRASKAKDSIVSAQVEVLRRLIEIVKADTNPEAAAEKLTGLLAEIANDVSDKLPKEFKDALGAGGGTLNALATRLNSPWFRYFLTYDPRPTLQKVECPVLAVIGENDLQVPADANLAEIDKALKAGGNARYSVEKLAGLNHLFQHSKTGSPLEYGVLEETFAPEALARISSWILEQASGR